jgi:hypothetical protein
MTESPDKKKGVVSMQRYSSQVGLKTIGLGPQRLRPPDLWRESDMHFQHPRIWGDVGPHWRAAGELP